MAKSLLSSTAFPVAAHGLAQRSRVDAPNRKQQRMARRSRLTQASWNLAERRASIPNRAFTYTRARYFRATVRTFDGRAEVPHDPNRRKRA
jgi:hypothetical protein